MIPLKIKSIPSFRWNAVPPLAGKMNSYTVLRYNTWCTSLLVGLIGHIPTTFPQALQHPSETNSATLKMAAARSSETSNKITTLHPVITQTTNAANARKHTISQTSINRLVFVMVTGRCLIPQLLRRWNSDF